MSEKISWGTVSFKGDATAVYHEIQTLGDNYTPDEIVAKAKDPKTELHKCFDWDDTTAAEKWRKHTARLICCSLRVEVQVEDKAPEMHRIIQHDKTEMVYKPVIITVRNTDEYSRLLRQAKAELASFKKRYKSIVELDSVIDEIDKIINN